MEDRMVREVAKYRWADALTTSEPSYWPPDSTFSDPQQPSYAAYRDLQSMVPLYRPNLSRSTPTVPQFESGFQTRQEGWLLYNPDPAPWRNRSQILYPALYEGDLQGANVPFLQTSPPIHNLFGTAQSLDSYANAHPGNLGPLPDLTLEGFQMMTAYDSTQIRVHSQIIPELSPEVRYLFSPYALPQTHHEDGYHETSQDINIHNVQSRSHPLVADVPGPSMETWQTPPDPPPDVSQPGAYGRVGRISTMSKQNHTVKNPRVEFDSGVFTVSNTSIRARELSVEEVLRYSLSLVGFMNQTTPGHRAPDEDLNKLFRPIGPKSWKCQFDNFTTNYPRRRYEHALQHIRNLPYRCIVCDKSFSRPENHPKNHKFIPHAKNPPAMRQRRRVHPFTDRDDGIQHH